MKQIMNRFDNKKEEPSINEIQSEVNLLKEEIREVKSRLHKIEIEALTKQLLKEAEGTSKGKDPTHSDNEENGYEGYSSPGYETEVGVNMITKVRPQSSHILIKLVINNNLFLTNLLC